MKYQVSPLVNRDLIKILKDVSKIEGIDKSPVVLREIAKVSEGSPRHALVLLEQISEITDEKLSLEVINKGLVSETKTIELCRALLKKNWGDGAVILKGLTAEPENVRYAVLGYFNTVLLSHGDDQTANTMLLFTESFIYSGKAGLTLACFLACK